MPAKKKKSLKANDGSYAGMVLVAYDDLEQDYVCFMCGGSGYLEDECECSAFEDTCCCASPTPRECPECRRERRNARRSPAIASGDEGGGDG